MELLWSFQLIEADPEWVEKVGWAGLGWLGWARVWTHCNFLMCAEWAEGWSVAAY